MQHICLKAIGCVLGLILAAQLTVLGQNTPAAGFDGKWANNDFKTKDITRVQIQVEGNRIVVHMWGRCQPTECDWGETTAKADGQDMSLIWNQGFCVRTQKLKLLDDGNLQVIEHCHFTDKSGRNDHDTKNTLAKGIAHDWSDPPSPSPIL